MVEKTFDYLYAVKLMETKEDFGKEEENNDLWLKNLLVLIKQMFPLRWFTKNEFEFWCICGTKYKAMSKSTQKID